MPTTYTVRTTMRTTTRRRRSDGLFTLFAVATAFSLTVAIFSGVRGRRVARRAAFFGGIPGCANAFHDLPDATASWTDDGARVCWLVPVRVVRQLVRVRGTSHYYGLAFTTPGGALDSAWFGMVTDKPFWSAAVPGTIVLAQRFRDSTSTAPTRTTTLRLDTLAARTKWNPLWLSDDSAAGAVGFGFFALLGVVGMIVKRPGRRRD